MSVGILYSLLVLIPNIRSWAMQNYVVLWIALGLLLMITFIYAMANSELIPGFKKYLGWWMFFFSILSMFMVFVPTNKQLAMVAAGYVLTNGPVAKVESDMMKSVEKFFDKIAADEEKAENPPVEQKKAEKKDQQADNNN